MQLNNLWLFGRVGITDSRLSYQEVLVEAQLTGLAC